jgi:hypothetical protein
MTCLVFYLALHGLAERVLQPYYKLEFSIELSRPFLLYLSPTAPFYKWLDSTNLQCPLLFSKFAYRPLRIPGLSWLWMVRLHV